MQKLAIAVFAAAHGCLAAAQAGQLPPRKPGLWQVMRTLAAPARPGVVAQYCIDAATADLLIDFRDGPTKEMCPNNAIAVHGLRVTADAACTIAASAETVHTTITFDGDTAFHRVTEARYAPAYVGRTFSATTHEGKWLGPCPVDMKPGDVIGPSGARVNLRPSPAIRRPTATR